MDVDAKGRRCFQNCLGFGLNIVSYVAALVLVFSEEPGRVAFILINILTFIVHVVLLFFALRAFSRKKDYEFLTCMAIVSLFPAVGSKYDLSGML